MTLLKRTKFIRALLLLSTASMLFGCGTVNSGQHITEPKPHPDPLSAEILQAMQPNSTNLLNRADVWLKSSDQQLNSETPKPGL